MLTKSNMNITGKGFLKRKEELNFNLKIQRNYVWNNEVKSMFIHSLMYGYPVPPIYAIEKDGTQYNFIDGKQRISTLIAYQEDEFALDDNTPDVDDYEVAGKKFSELPEDLQDNIKDYSLLIYVYKELTDDEVEEMFFRLNFGVPLTEMEKTRSIIGEEMLDFLAKYAKSEFFKKINLTNTDRKRFNDEALVLQIMTIVTDNIKDFRSKTLREFGLSFKESGISTELTADMDALFDYLNKAFPLPDKSLKKAHIPPVIAVALDAKDDNVDPQLFGNFVLSFLKHQAEIKKEAKKNDTYMGRYNEAANSGTTKKESIEARIDEMLQAYEAFIDGAEEQEDLIGEILNDKEETQNTAM